MTRLKKCITSVLVLSMLVSIITPSVLASGTTYTSQILHAVGVNEYGTNIHDEDVAETLTNIPLEIAQLGRNLRVTGTIDGENISLIATPRGKNGTENMIYFDVEETGNNHVSVLTMMYIEGCTPAAIISDHESANCETVLKLYLKNTESTEKEYYFVEVFDFAYANFNEAVDALQVCGSDHWNSAEFLPIETEEGIGGVIPAAVPADKLRKITETYMDAAALTFQDTMEVRMIHDYKNISRKSDAEWMHSITVENKYSICKEDSTFSDMTGCPMQLKDVSMKVFSPKNTAFFKTVIDGRVTKLSTVTLSASIGIVIGTKTAGMSVGATYTPTGQVDINKAYTAYVNSNSQGYTRNIKLDLNKNCVLRNKGDRFIIVNTIRDYGDVATASETIYASWSWTANHYIKPSNTAGVQTQSFSCRVE